MQQHESLLQTDFFFGQTQKNEFSPFFYFTKKKFNPEAKKKIYKTKLIQNKNKQTISDTFTEE